MDASRIDRINELYHKSQSVGLTDEEKEEQAKLRRGYCRHTREPEKQPESYFHTGTGWFCYGPGEEVRRNKGSLGLGELSPKENQTGLCMDRRRERRAQ